MSDSRLAHHRAILALKTDAGSGSLEQIMLAEFCERHYSTHLETLRPVLKEKCQANMDALATNFGSDAQFSAPKGGILILVRLPEHVDTTRLAEVAAAQGVAINPGADWTVDGAKIDTDYAFV